MTKEMYTIIKQLDPKGHLPIEPLPNGATLVYIPTEFRPSQNTQHGLLVVAYGYDVETGEWSHGHYIGGTPEGSYDTYKPAVQEVCEYCGLPVEVEA